MSVSARRTPLWLWCLLAYSAAHFLYSAVVSAWSINGGDVLLAFPGPPAVRFAHWLVPSHDWVSAHMAWNGGGQRWNYGPVLHAVTLPLVLASTHVQAMHLLLALDGLVVCATFWLWRRLLLPPRGAATAVVAIACVWLNHFPLLEAVAGREIELLELFLITVGVRALRRNHDGCAGVAFGLAALTKFLPAIFIPYLFLKGRWRAAWAATGTAAVIALIAQPVLGWQRSVTLKQASQEQSGTFDLVPTAYSNQSLTNVLHKTFTAFNIDDPRPATLYPESLRFAGLGLSVAVLLLTAVFLWRWRRGQLVEVECALLAIVMCLVAPHANTYYFVFLLPALSIALAALLQDSASFGAAPKAALAAAVFLSGFLLPMGVYARLTGLEGILVARVLQGWSLPAYGAILAAGLMVEIHRVQRRSAG